MPLCYAVFLFQKTNTPLCYGVKRTQLCYGAFPLKNKNNAILLRSVCLQKKRHFAAERFPFKKKTCNFVTERFPLRKNRKKTTLLRSVSCSKKTLCYGVFPPQNIRASLCYGAFPPQKKKRHFVTERFPFKKHGANPLKKRHFVIELFPLKKNIWLRNVFSSKRKPLLRSVSFSKKANLRCYGVKRTQLCYGACPLKNKNNAILLRSVSA